jgi:hypothetical protein
VNDEAEYWDTGDVELLKNYLANCYRFIEEQRQERPNQEVRVKTPAGRIVDLITYDSSCESCPTTRPRDPASSGSGQTCSTVLVRFRTLFRCHLKA